MRLRTVAQENDIAHDDGKGLYAETEVLPTLMAPEEQGSQDDQDNDLYNPVVRQQERFQSTCEEQSCIVHRTMVVEEIVPHITVEVEEIELRIDGGQQE